jgi:hypothetical protein
MDALASIIAVLLRIAGSGASRTFPTLIQLEKTHGETSPVGLMAAFPVPHPPQSWAMSGALFAALRPKWRT